MGIIPKIIKLIIFLLTIDKQRKYGILAKTDDKM